MVDDNSKNINEEKKGITDEPDGVERIDSLFQNLMKKTLTGFALASLFLDTKPHKVVGASDAPKEKPYDPLAWNPTRLGCSAPLADSGETEGESNSDFLAGFDLTATERDALRVGPELNPESLTLIPLKSTGDEINYLDSKLPIISITSFREYPPENRGIKFKGVEEIKEIVRIETSDKGFRNTMTLEQIMADHERNMVSPDFRIAIGSVKEIGDDGCFEYRSRDIFGIPRTWRRASAAQLVMTFERYELTPSQSARAVIGVDSSKPEPVRLGQSYDYNQLTIRLQGVLLYDADNKYIGFAPKKKEVSNGKEISPDKDVGNGNKGGSDFYFNSLLKTKYIPPVKK